MSVYKLYVIDEKGHSASWSHTEGFKGKACMVFPDYTNNTIVIEHPTATTYMFISKDGELDIAVEEKVKPKPKLERKKRSRRRVYRR